MFFKNKRKGRFLKMKNKWFVGIGVLLVFWFILAGCTTAGSSPGTTPQPVAGGGGETNNEEKTIVITGFDLEGQTPTNAYLINEGADPWQDPDWVMYCMVDNTIFDGNTITLPLWVHDGKEVGTRFTGTGKYRLLVVIDDWSGRYMWVDRVNGGVDLDIKEAVTTVRWSDFDKQW
jgi:hypothetical protein